jgi:beta-lactamase superfamily II metal-dependent hydrolase
MKGNQAIKRIIWIALISVYSLAFASVPLAAQDFEGFDSTALPPVTNTLGDWGLKIVIMKVGQADAILVMTPNGDTCLIDSGKNKSNCNQIADLLSSKTVNGVGNIKTVDLLYTTHYDLDHIGGLPSSLSEVLASERLLTRDYLRNVL